MLSGASYGNIHPFPAELTTAKKAGLPCYTKIPICENYGNFQKKEKNQNSGYNQLKISRFTLPPIASLLIL